MDSESLAEVMQIADIFRVRIVDLQPKSLVIEITGAEGKVEVVLPGEYIRWSVNR